MRRKKRTLADELLTDAIFSAAQEAKKFRARQIGEIPVQAWMAGWAQGMRDAAAIQKIKVEKERLEGGTVVGRDNG